jgi:2,4-dienoyl-CoA reductase-like NADH-dependent reductase (Old Yellow Enzyme family)
VKFGEYPKIASFDTPGAFLAYAHSHGLDFPCDDAILPGGETPLGQSKTVCGRTLTNRFAILPMEGWDGTQDGRPTDNTRRRWQNFGRSGAKFIWGGEAVAVRHDGRANPRQLCMTAESQGDIAALRDVLIEAHTDPASENPPGDLLIGLQLTHSGRFSRPNPGGKLEPSILYHHPVLDRKFNLPADHAVMSDDDISRLIEDYVLAAKRAHACGYDFVDLKSCHGYLGHEFLSAVHRPGRFGGSLENRTRFLREMVAGIRAEAPGLEIGVRISAFDLIPYRPDPAQSDGPVLGPGVPEEFSEILPYDVGFGSNPQNPTDYDLSSVFALCRVLGELGITMLNVSAGSPYYNPHVTRPALYPPSDGYRPPEEPLVGVLRLLDVARRIKAQYPDLVCVGSGYTYLQEYLPNVGQAVVRDGWTDFVGLGRMVLAYPELPRDVLVKGEMRKKRLCRTFSDCTTAPRNGIVSGCYPLDPKYKTSPEFKILAGVKKAAKLA